MAADLDKIIARLTDEETPFTRLSRQGIVGAVEKGNLSFEQANQLIDDAQAQAAGTAPAQEPPDITANDLSIMDRGRPLSASEAAIDAAPAQTIEEAHAQLSASLAGDKKVQGEVKLSDDRVFQVDATEEEIRQFISEQEDLITEAKQAQADGGDQEAMQGLQTEIQADKDLYNKTFLEEVGSNLVAEADIGMTLLTGAVAEPVSGIAGLLGLGMSFGDPDVAADWVEGVSEFLTWSPKSDKAKAALGAVGEKLMVVEEVVDDIAVKASGGNPFAATAIKTAIIGSLDIIAGGKGFLRKVKIDKGLRRAQQMADDLGINTEPTAIKTSLVNKIKEMTPEEFASNQPGLRQEMLAAERAQKTAVTQKFEEAKTVDAYVKADSIEEFGAGLREHLIDEGFDLDDLKKVNDTIEDLVNIRTRKPGRGPRDNVGEFGSGAAPKQLIEGKVVDVQLNDLQLIRKRINRRHSRAQDAGESNAALSLTKNKLDEFLQNQFDADAIRGDKAGVTRWKEANDAFTDYKKNFSEDRFIKKMIEEDAMPEQYRRWFVGANAMGASPQVGSTLKRLKKILGDDSPQIDAIRADLLHDVARPIFEGIGGNPARPDFQGFIKNYDRMIGKNPSMVKALDLDMADMKGLRDLAKAELAVRGRRVMNLDLSTGIARFVFGHKIARAAMRVTMARGLIDMMFQTGKTGRRSILAHAIGQPDILRTPLIPRSGAFAGGVIAEQFNQQARKNEDRQR